jgi:succinate dehydrogenase / fumarate reductase, cytochrome b subunit
MPQVPQAASKKRPVWFNLSLFNLPLPGKVSILHRISGALLYLLLPAVLYALDASLASPEVYAAMIEGMQHPFVKLVLFGLIWAFVQHTLSGIRLLLLDLHLGADLHTARASARVVMMLSPAVTLLFAWIFLL